MRKEGTGCGGWERGKEGGREKNLLCFHLVMQSVPSVDEVGFKSSQFREPAKLLKFGNLSL